MLATIKANLLLSRIYMTILATAAPPPGFPAAYVVDMKGFEMCISFLLQRASCSSCISSVNISLTVSGRAWKHASLTLFVSLLNDRLFVSCFCRGKQIQNADTVPKTRLINIVFWGDLFMNMIKIVLSPSPHTTC